MIARFTTHRLPPHVDQSPEEAQRALAATGVKGGYALKAGSVSLATLFRQLDLVTQ